MGAGEGSGGLVVLGARAPVYRTVIVRDRHTGKLAEVPLAPCEAPPIDEGDEGTTYVFAKGEKVPADHPVVIERPARLSSGRGVSPARPYLPPEQHPPGARGNA